MGKICVGRLLDMGPERNVGAHNMDSIRALSTYQNCTRLERETGGMDFHYRFCSDNIYAVRSELSPFGIALLRINGALLKQSILALMYKASDRSRHVYYFTRAL